MYPYVEALWLLDDSNMLDSVVDFAALGSKSRVCVAEQTAKKKIMTYCGKNRANVANSPIIR